MAYSFTRSSRLRAIRRRRTVTRRTGMPWRSKAARALPLGPDAAIRSDRYYQLGSSPMGILDRFRRDSVAEVDDPVRSEFIFESRMGNLQMRDLLIDAMASVGVPASGVKDDEVEWHVGGAEVRCAQMHHAPGEEPYRYKIESSPPPNSAAKVSRTLNGAIAFISKRDPSAVII